MKILNTPITLTELSDMAEKMFGDMVKAVVDVGRGVMVVDAELHADEESALLAQGSKQKDLWGINLYPELGKEHKDFVEFDSMINLRPSQNNRSRSVDDPEIRKAILAIIDRLVV